MVRLLLKYGAKVNARNGEKEVTALYISALQVWGLYTDVRLC